MKNEKRKDVYDRQFKLKFMGYGDWLDEPDEVSFEYRDIKCLVIRMVKREPYAREETYFGGHFCVYIFLKEDHPLYGKDISDIDLDCHGGVTYSALTIKGFMIGFDCAHSGDLVPTTEHLKNTMHELKEIRKRYPPPPGYEKHPLFKQTYKNLAFCIRECKKLAKQASKMSILKGNNESY